MVICKGVDYNVKKEKEAEEEIPWNKKGMQRKEDEDY